MEHLLNVMLTESKKKNKLLRLTNTGNHRIINIFISLDLSTQYVQPVTVSCSSVQLYINQIKTAVSLIKHITWYT